MSTSIDVSALSTADLDVLAAKLAERLRDLPSKPDYQLVQFSFVGNELRAIVRTPSGEVYQGVVTNWEKVKVVEVKQ